MASLDPFPVSAFGDESGSSLEEQIAGLVRCRIGGLDLRSVDGVNVLDLDDAALDAVHESCLRAGRRVQCVGSPINKVRLDGTTHDTQIRKLHQAIHAARRLGTTRIRIFTPEVAHAEEDAAWPELARIVGDMAALAHDHGLMLIHENDARYFGAYPRNSRKLFDAFGGPAFKAAFDFANTVLIGFRPMLDWFPWLLPHLDTLHIKDAVESSGEIVPAGEGDGELVETLTWLIGQGWHGPVTLEPHLLAAGPLGGHSGPELFDVAAKALRSSVERAGGRTEVV